MSTRDPYINTPASAIDPLTPTGEQGSANEGDQGMTGKASDLAGQAKDKAGDVAGKAEDLTRTAQEKATEAGRMAQEKADAGMDAAASGLGQAASMLRQQGEQREGTVGDAATRTADTLESASSYLQNKDTSQILDDIEAFVRQRPVESVLIAAGIGFILSKIVK
ncbi:MAG TPA: hypothetical protein VD767_10365 [Thermomicrobiales bacterium]|nr:hypothetical protein [Thermomicrobiales bacterium]